MFFENDIIRLRPLEPEDLDILYLWENDVKIWNVSNTIVPRSRYALKQYIENSHKDIFETGQLRLMIEEKASISTIGTIDLFDFDPMHERIELGALVYSEKNRRQKFASSALNLIIDYCFNILHLRQVYCNVDENNTKSIKMLTNIGFDVVGTKKQWIKAGNGWQNEILLQKINPQR
jgi:diamine N-acetyltransferase